MFFEIQSAHLTAFLKTRCKKLGRQSRSVDRRRAGVGASMFKSASMFKGGGRIRKIYCE